jgi:excisionase family DNA binding protein
MLSTSEAAALAGTTRFTVEREIRRGNLEAEKVSGRWLITEDEARRWAAGYEPFREQRQRHRAPAAGAPPADSARQAIRKLPPMR